MANPLTPEQLLTLLAEAPRRLMAAAAAVSPALLRAAPGPDEWSADDILAHLRACSDTWGGYIRRILAKDHPTFRAVNPRTWIDQTDYPDLAFHPSLRAYTAQRAELLSLLRSLPPAGWSRSATVTGVGKPLELTVQSYADRLAVHERSHLKQIERTITAIASRM